MGTAYTRSPSTTLPDGTAASRRLLFSMVAEQKRALVVVPVGGVILPFTVTNLGEDPAVATVLSKQIFAIVTGGDGGAAGSQHALLTAQLRDVLGITMALTMTIESMPKRRATITLNIAVDDSSTDPAAASSTVRASLARALAAGGGLATTLTALIGANVSIAAMPTVISPAAASSTTMPALPQSAPEGQFASNSSSPLAGAGGNTSSLPLVLGVALGGGVTFFLFICGVFFARLVYLKRCRRVMSSNSVAAGAEEGGAAGGGAGGRVSVMLSAANSKKNKVTPTTTATAGVENVLAGGRAASARFSFWLMRSNPVSVSRSPY